MANVATMIPSDRLTYFMSIAVMCVAVGSFAVQGIAIIIAGEIIVYVAGGIAMVVASAVGVRQVSVVSSWKSVSTIIRDGVVQSPMKSNISQPHLPAGYMLYPLVCTPF